MLSAGLMRSCRGVVRRCVFQARHLPTSSATVGGKETWIDQRNNVTNNGFRITRTRHNTVRFLCTESEDASATSFNVQDADDFEDRVLHSETPVIVDFHAHWCGPCKQLGPRLEAKVDGKEGRVLLAKVDIDDLSDMALDYGVQAVPAVFAFKNGEVVDQFLGDRADEEIDAFINRLLGE